MVDKILAVWPWVARESFDEVQQATSDAFKSGDIRQDTSVAYSIRHNSLRGRKSFDSRIEYSSYLKRVASELGIVNLGLMDDDALACAIRILMVNGQGFISRYSSARLPLYSINFIGLASESKRFSHPYTAVEKHVDMEFWTPYVSGQLYDEGTTQGPLTRFGRLAVIDQNKPIEHEDAVFLPQSGGFSYISDDESYEVILNPRREKSLCIDLVYAKLGSMLVADDGIVLLSISPFCMTFSPMKKDNSSIRSGNVNRHIIIPDYRSGGKSFYYVRKANRVFPDRVVNPLSMKEDEVRWVEGDGALITAINPTEHKTIIFCKELNPSWRDII